MAESVIIPLARLKELEAAAAEVLVLRETLKKLGMDKVVDKVSDRNARRRELYRLKKAAAAVQPSPQPQPPPQKPDVSESESDTG